MHARAARAADGHSTPSPFINSRPLRRYDTHHGKFMQGKISYEGDMLNFGGKKIKFLQIASPKDILLKALGVTIVIECTGKFTDAAKLQPFLDNGAKRVVVSAPVKTPGVPNIVLGVNEQTYVPKEHKIVTAASCTTNCIAPVIKLLHDKVMGGWWAAGRAEAPAARASRRRASLEQPAAALPAPALHCCAAFQPPGNRAQNPCKPPTLITTPPLTQTFSARPAREQVGVRHGSITTIHCLTNTQSVLDAAWCAEKEPRRARGSVNNFYPTTTGSAKAVTEVRPRRQRPALGSSLLRGCSCECCRAAGELLARALPAPFLRREALTVTHSP